MTNEVHIYSATVTLAEGSVEPTDTPAVTDARRHPMYMVYAHPTRSKQEVHNMVYEEVTTNLDGDVQSIAIEKARVQSLDECHPASEPGIVDDAFATSTVSRLKSLLSF